MGICLVREVLGIEFIDNAAETAVFSAVIWEAIFETNF